MREIFQYNKNLRDFFSVNVKLKKELKELKDYIEKHQKFKSSVLSKTLSPVQQMYFEDVAAEVEARIKIIENNLKILSSLAIDNIENNEANNNALTEIMDVANQSNLPLPTNELVDYANSLLDRFGDEDFASESSRMNYFKHLLRQLNDPIEKWKSEKETDSENDGD